MDPSDIGTAFDALPPTTGPEPVGGSLLPPPGTIGSGSMLGAAAPRPVWDLLRIPLGEPAAVPAAPLADLPGLFEPPPVNLWEDKSIVRTSGVGIEAPRPPKPAPRAQREHSSWNVFEDDEPPPPPPPKKRLTLGHVVAIVAFLASVAFVAVFVVHSNVPKPPPAAPTTGTDTGVAHR